MGIATKIIESALMKTHPVGEALSDKDIRCIESALESTGGPKHFQRRRLDRVSPDDVVIEKWHPAVRALVILSLAGLAWTGTIAAAQQVSRLIG